MGPKLSMCAGEGTGAEVAGARSGGAGGSWCDTLPESLGRVESCLLRGLQHASEQQYVGFSGPPRPALKEALSRIQMASTAVEVWKTSRVAAQPFSTCLAAES
eukprot:scaffold11757_cov100-Phaeocystis_antarctica.AAC.2